MQSSMQREIEDPKNFAQAYGFHPITRFYTGLVRRQENPREPGSFLLPGFSTEKRPVFLEGHRPRWTGETWELVPKEPAMQTEAKIHREVGEMRDDLASEMRKVIEDMVKSELQRRTSELHHELVALMDSKFAMLQEFAEASLTSKVEVKVDHEIGRVSDMIHAVASDIQQIERRAHDIHAQTLNAANQVLEQTTAAQQAMSESLEKSQSWWKFWERNEKTPVEHENAEGGA